MQRSAVSSPQASGVWLFRLALWAPCVVSPVLHTSSSCPSHGQQQQPTPSAERGVHAHGTGWGAGAHRPPLAGSLQGETRACRSPVAACCVWCPLAAPHTDLPGSTGRRAPSPHSLWAQPLLPRTHTALAGGAGLPEHLHAAGVVHDKAHTTQRPAEPLHTTANRLPLWPQQAGHAPVRSGCLPAQHSLHDVPFCLGAFRRAHTGVRPPALAAQSGW